MQHLSELIEDAQLGEPPLRSALDDFARVHDSLRFAAERPAPALLSKLDKLARAVIES